jgi:hypothetical protein
VANYTQLDAKYIPSTGARQQPVGVGDEDIFLEIATTGSVPPLKSGQLETD